MRRWLAAIAFVLLLGACEASAQIELEDDGSGTFGFSLLIEKAILQGLGGLGGADPFKDLSSGLDDRFDVEKITTADSEGFKATLPFASVEELRKLATEMAEDANESPFETSFKDFVLERRGGGWHFEANSAAPNLGSGFPGGGSGSPGGDFGFGDQIAEQLKVSMRIILPGRKVSTTATESTFDDGKTTFIWRPDLKNPKPMRLVATTRGAGSGSGFPVVPVAIGGGAIAAAALAGAIVTSRRRTPLPVGAPDVTVDPATTPFPPPSTAEPPAAPPPVPPPSE